MILDGFFMSAAYSVKNPTKYGWLHSQSVDCIFWLHREKKIVLPRHRTPEECDQERLFSITRSGMIGAYATHGSTQRVS